MRQQQPSMRTYRFRIAFVFLALLISGQGCASIENRSGIGKYTPSSTSLFSYDLTGNNFSRPPINRLVRISSDCGRIFVLSVGPVAVLPLPIIPFLPGLYEYYVRDGVTELRNRVLKIQVDVSAPPSEFKFTPAEARLRVDDRNLAPVDIVESELVQEKVVQVKVLGGLAEGQDISREVIGKTYVLSFDRTCGSVQNATFHLNGFNYREEPKTFDPIELGEFRSKTVLEVAP